MPDCRLVYKSETSWDLLSNEILRDLALKAETNNSSQSISGLLILSGETFLQVLEGPSDLVNPLYHKILKDERHHDVTLISYEQIATRCFDDWSMRVVELDDLPMASRENLWSKYDTDDGSVTIPEDAPKALALLFDARALCRSEGD
jgi:hypothetical protein